MRRMLRTLTVALVVAAASAMCVSAAAPGAVSAGLQDFEFSSLDVDYTIGRADDGTSTLLVEETYVAVFPEIDQNRGMQVRIPESYLNVPLFPELISITDGEGDERESETETDDGFLIATSRADDYVHGEQTYVFTYELHNVVRFFENTGVDEFYWNVNGVEWAQPFGEVSATLHVPAELAESLTGATACYRGYQDSTDRCEISSTPADGGEVDVRAGASGLLPNQTVTMAVAFAAGTFEPFDSTYLASPWGWLQALAGLLAAASVVFAGIVRARWLRDAPGRPTIIAEYTPPRDIDALESAVLLGKTTKAIPAEVLEQAVVGSIRIVEGAKGFWGSTKLEAHLVDPSKADGDGLMLIEGLFGRGPDPRYPEKVVYEFGKQDTRLSVAAQKILKAATSELTRRGLRRPVPSGVRVWPVLASVLGAVLVFVFGIAAIDAGVVWYVPVPIMVVSVILVFVVVGMVSRHPLTALGAETRDHLAGLREFIEWAEADRIRMLQSPRGAERRAVDTGDPAQMLHLYEVLLPYAVVFGQEKEWAKELAVLYGEGNSPGWYSGSSGFNAAAFSAGIGSLSSSASASSSTSGGSGGGGSAGGGGGGGGGGGV